MSKYAVLTGAENALGASRSGGLVSSNMTPPNAGFGSQMSSLSGINFSGIDSDPLMVADRAGNLRAVSEALTFILPKNIEVDAFYTRFDPRCLIIQMIPTWRMRGIGPDSGVVFSFAGLTKFLRDKYIELHEEMDKGRFEGTMMVLKGETIKKRYQEYKRLLYNGDITLSGLVLKECELNALTPNEKNESVKKGHKIPDDIFDYKWALDDPFLVQMCFFDVGYMNANGGNTVLYDIDRDSQPFKKMRETRKGQAINIKGLTEANVNVVGKITQYGRISMYLRIKTGDMNYVYPEIRCGASYGDFKGEDEGDLYGKCKGTWTRDKKITLGIPVKDDIKGKYKGLVNRFITDPTTNAADWDLIAKTLNCKVETKQDAVVGGGSEPVTYYHLRRYPCYYLGVVQQNQGRSISRLKSYVEEDIKLEQYSTDASPLVIWYKM